MTTKTIKILFLIIGSRINQTNKSAVKCRITYLKKRKEFSTGIFINPLCWNSKQQQAEPPEPDVNYINTQLSLIRQHLKYIFNELFSLEGQTININAISNYKSSNPEQLVTIKDLILLCISNNETFIGCIEDGNLYLNPSKNKKIKNVNDLSLVVIS